MHRLAFALSCCVAALALTAAAGARADHHGGASPAPKSWSVGFTTLGKRILTGADANAVVLPDGRIRLYWAPGDGLGSAVSRDGVHFTREPGVRLDPSIGGPHTRILALADGGWRLYFNDRGGKGIRSAVSSDGLNFEIEPGLRVSSAAAGVAPKELSPGDVLRLPDGRLRMYFSTFFMTHRDPRTAHEVVKSAVSSDGLEWTVEPGVRAGGSTGITGSSEHPAAIRRKDGKVALFYGRPSPFHAYVSLSSDGVKFEAEQPFVDAVLDTAAVPRPDGSYLVYYGTHVPETNTSYINVGRLVFRSTPPVPTCIVPFVMGKPLAAAKAAVAGANCGVAVRQVRSKHSAGIVVAQRPKDTGTTLRRGTKVTLDVSVGPGRRG